MWCNTTKGIPTLIVDPLEPTSASFPDWPPEEVLSKIGAKAGHPVIVDLSGVAQTRSDFIGYLARLKQLLSAQACPMVLVLSHPELKRTFDVLNLHKVFNLAGGLEEAVTWCQQGGPSRP